MPAFSDDGEKEAKELRELAKACSELTNSKDERLSYDVVPKSDFGKFAEYSVVHTNRSLNIMSDPFQTVMRDLNSVLQATYNADKVVIIPGSGTFGMEAVARQFATGEHVIVVRNGWFSYRWTEIFDMGGIPKSHTVLKARPVEPSSADEEHAQYTPCPVDEVVAKVYEERPAALFCATWKPARA